MNGRFAGKVVLVAGGTGGLGRAVSIAFLQERAKVVVTYRPTELLLSKHPFLAVQLELQHAGLCREFQRSQTIWRR